MRNRLIGPDLKRVIALLSAACALPLALAEAEAAPVEGRVVDTNSRWGYANSAIVTESVIERPSGEQITVHQLGGSVGGIGMRITHSPMLLPKGSWVRLETSAAPTLSGGVAHQVKSVVSLRSEEASSDLKDAELEQQDFVRTTNKSGAHVHWKSGCAFISVASEGSSQIEGEQEFQVIDQVLAHWTQETRSCSHFELINEGPDDREVGLDGVNLIKFRDDFWCRPASGSDPQECYDQAAAGLTTLFFIDDESSGRNGEIIDADIEFNGVQFAFSVGGVSGGNQDCEADLANTLTHEIGHFIGLDHTCWTGGTRLQDDQGNEVPSCSGSGLGPAITDATMYNFQSCGETLKTSLTADDVAGFCGIYPTATTTTSCKRADIEPAGCCSIAGGPSEPSSPKQRGALLLLVLALGALGLARRRA